MKGIRPSFGANCRGSLEVDLYIMTDSVDDLYRRLKDRVQVVVDVYDALYGMREFIIRDFNGFWITFGQPIQT